MNTPNTDLIATARANVAERLHQPYQRRAVLRGDWDDGALVKDEIELLLKRPVLAEGEEA